MRWMLIGGWMLGWGLVCAAPWPGTAPLETNEDLGATLVAGISRYLDRATSAAPTARDSLWQDRTVWPEHRDRLREILGVVDSREAPALRVWQPVQPTSSSAPSRDSAVARSVVWNVVRGITGEGLWLEPVGSPQADVVLVPDPDVTPEQLAGLADGLPASEQLGRLLAAAGCRVLIPARIDRSSRFAGNPGVRSVGHSQRETLWRAAYQVGRHPLGYDLQTVLAAADALLELRGTSATGRPLGVVGYGGGGTVAVLAGAVDERFQVVASSGSMGLTAGMASLPIEENVWSWHTRFGDAEVAALVAPRWLGVETGRYPQHARTDAHGAAPGRIERPAAEVRSRERRRLESLWPAEVRSQLLWNDPGADAAWSESTTSALWAALGLPAGSGSSAAAPTLPAPLTDGVERTLRLYRQILEDTQRLMRESKYQRQEWWKSADRRSADAFTQSTTPFREYFRDHVVGVLPPPSVAPAVQSRLRYETNGIRGYDVVLQVHPDVFAYGILVVPAGIQPGERRPVVVCQHGLEGRPEDVSDPRVQNDAYHRYGYRLAEQGYITFAPQNAYLGGTTFRQVLRQAQPLGLTLWSFIVRQHEVITDWLAVQPGVDPDRIAFYGLSYGGKTAMRVPVLVPRYCLSICSADFNEWIWKNVSDRSPYSYLWTSEYDMPEWDLAARFNYAEMAWMIFPRPFMVERGHDDGVAPDEWVAYEYARVRRHYVKLGRGDATEIEFFDGPHTIHGVGTFQFLARHLRWPAGAGP